MSSDVRVACEPAHGEKMSIQCPKCGSDHIQSIRAVLQSGTTYSTGSVVGVGVGTNGAGTFGGTTSNTFY